MLVLEEKGQISLKKNIVMLADWLWQYFVDLMYFEKVQYTRGISTL